MIYALVNVQKSAGKMDDIIAGKGNGLIILLHGSPGTGKTLTAERFVSETTFQHIFLAYLLTGATQRGRDCRKALIPRHMR